MVVSFFRKVKRKAGFSAAGRLLSKEQKYALYEKVANDLNGGEQDLGVWATAFAEVKGDDLC